MEISEAVRALGHHSIREHQKPVLDSVLSGRDALAVLPTGGGKSALYQIPALVKNGLVVVVSPLVSLMRDQVEKLKQISISAAAFNSHASISERRAVLEGIREGSLRLLYLSPEKMMSISPSFFEGSTVTLYAVDEAHCISEWGHDFRTSYLHLGKNLAKLPSAPTLALTATATTETQTEIVQLLGLGDRRVVDRHVSSPDRKNLAYFIAGPEAKLEALVRRAGFPSVVYGQSRESVEEACNILVRGGVRARFYHAGMLPKDRSEAQDAFLSGEIECIVATCAFGMGIDHGGVRSVVHLGMPSTIESYIQEAGRAGRDGEYARAVILPSTKAPEISLSYSSQNWPPVEVVRSVYETLTRIASHGEVHLSFTEIATKTRFAPEEVESAVRILEVANHLVITPAHERLVAVHLVGERPGPRAPKQRHTYDTLRKEADTDGYVEGTKSFFTDCLLLERPFLLEMQERGTLTVEWPDAAHILRLKAGGDPAFDEDRVTMLRERSVQRARAAFDYVFHKRCLREYLTGYFGFSTMCTDVLCQRCGGGKK